MAIGSVGDRSSVMMGSVLTLRRQLDDLQNQLGTGRKSDTFAGLGVNRGLDVALRAQLSSIDAFGANMTMAGTRLDVMQSTLTRLSTIGRDIKSGAQQSFGDLNGNGQTTAQQRAMDSLAEVLDLLNTQAGDRFVFGGRQTDAAPVASITDVLNGNGARAGLKTVIAERLTADQGAGGMGRLVMTTPTAVSTSLAEDAVGSPFGLKFGAVISNLSATTVNGPVGAPPAVSVDFGVGYPQPGEAITLNFTLPDGTADSITLTATTASPPGANGFTIGATAAATNTNFQTALTAAIQKVTDTTMVAASASAASKNFFDNPPMRVSGAPATATALVAGTQANTVFWYTGDASGGPARATASVRIDQSIAVNYGARADENALRNLVQNIALFAAVTTNAANPNAKDQVQALNQRTVANMASKSGVQSVEDIEAELAGAQTSITAAKARHEQATGIAENMMQKIEGVSTEELASQILALQTNLQASLQTTSLLYKTTLVNFI